MVTPFKLRTHVLGRQLFGPAGRLLRAQPAVLHAHRTETALCRYIHIYKEFFYYVYYNYNNYNYKRKVT